MLFVKCCLFVDVVVVMIVLSVVDDVVCFFSVPCLSMLSVNVVVNVGAALALTLIF